MSYTRTLKTKSAYHGLRAGPAIQFRGPSDSVARIRAIQKAALNPGIFSRLHQSHREASDIALRAHLITKEGFSEGAAKQFVPAFRETIALANFKGEPYNKPEHEETNEVRIGDLVQWLSFGVEQFEQPCRIQGFSEDGLWAFVEGSKTGLAVKDLVVVMNSSAQEKPLADPGKASPAPPLNPNLPEKILLSQTLVISIPRKFKVDLAVRGDELKKDDLAKIKSQFEHWISGLEEAFE